jgi:hypothetical protein
VEVILVSGGCVGRFDPFVFGKKQGELFHSQPMLTNSPPTLIGMGHHHMVAGVTFRVGLAK